VFDVMRKNQVDTRKLYDRKRDRESLTRPLYKTARWQRKRAAQLSDHPLCARCSTDERPVIACVAHHVIPHNGDVDAFWNNKLESVCASCHDVDIQREERGGRPRQNLDEDGWNL
jgi:hypothetical protein